MPKIVDKELEWEADHAGVIHIRKHPGETQILPGYGTTNFGVRGYVPKKTRRTGFLFAGALAISGLLAWMKRETLANYALLLRESLDSFPQISSAGDED